MPFVCIFSLLDTALTCKASALSPETEDHNEQPIVIVFMIFFSSLFSQQRATKTLVHYIVPLGTTVGFVNPVPLTDIFFPGMQLTTNCHPWGAVEGHCLGPCLDIKKYFFSESVDSHWHSCPGKW